MKKADLLHPVSTFHKPVPRPTRRDDQLRELRLGLQGLKQDLARAKDQQRRLREEIEEEIKIWSHLIETGKGISYEFARRRLSQLSGSLQYRGVIGAVEERREIL